MTGKHDITLEIFTKSRALFLAIICGLIISGNAAADMVCGGSLAKILFKQQIDNAQSEWGKLDQEIKSCVLKRTNQTSDELAGKCIGPYHSKISQELSSCQQTVEKARKEREVKAQRLAADKKAKARRLAADKKAQEEAHKIAMASAEARQLELTEKYGEEMANHILAGDAVKGMTSEQVIEAVGAPLRKESLPPNFELWIYKGMKIALRDGVVTHVDKSI